MKPTRVRGCVWLCSNVGAEPLAASISLDYLETDAQLLAVSSVEAAAALPRTLALQVPAFSCATSSVRFNMSAFELPLHVRTPYHLAPACTIGR